MFRRILNILAREKPVQSKGILLGLDNAGKSTLLYKLAGAKVETIIPTIGFNIEIVNTPSWKFTCWDVGGCDKIRPLWLNYLSGADFLLFVHDVSDQDRLVEAIEELHTMASALKDTEARYIFVMLNKQDLLSDEAQEKTLVEHRDRFERVLAPVRSRFRFYAEVMDLPGLSIITGNQLDVAMARIKKIVLGNGQETTNEKMTASHVDKAAPLPQPPTEKELLKRIQQANAFTNDADNFWHDFMAAELSAWDHFTHLRAGYFVLIEEMSKGKSVLETSDVFILHLERLRNAKPERFRNTTHRTMTIFWLSQLHHAARAYSAMDGVKTLPSRDEFVDVLRHSPQLMNSGTWREYYSKELMFSPQAKAEWCMPDLQSLPAFSTVDGTTLKGKS